MIVRKLGAIILAFTLAACADAGDETQTSGDSAATVPANVPDANAAAPADGQMLDPNTATAEQLAAIPNLNASLANAVVSGRPFQDMLGVDRVLSSLSEEQRDSVYTRLWKPLDLNKATAQEIELIPGVGPRMRHEFEEYRPYTSLEQFRREIGKYVDADEVARLERYVQIPTAQ
jgi:DNA uptake protein ComE-like DNA-binding protein